MKYCISCANTGCHFNGDRGMDINRCPLYIENDKEYKWDAGLCAEDTCESTVLLTMAEKRAVDKFISQLHQEGHCGFVWIDDKPIEFYGV